MAKRTTIIKGLSFNIMIEEIHQKDPSGGLICYVASIYLQEHGKDEKRLVRRSRIVGAADDLKREIKRDGIRVFDRFKNL